MIISEYLLDMQAWDVGLRCRPAIYTVRGKEKILPWLLPVTLSAKELALRAWKEFATFGIVVQDVVIPDIAALGIAVSDIAEPSISAPDIAVPCVAVCRPWRCRS